MIHQPPIVLGGADQPGGQPAVLISYTGQRAVHTVIQRPQAWGGGCSFLTFASAGLAQAEEGGTIDFA